MRCWAQEKITGELVVRREQDERLDDEPPRFSDTRGRIQVRRLRRVSFWEPWVECSHWTAVRNTTTQRGQSSAAAIQSEGGRDTPAQRHDHNGRTAVARGFRTPHHARGDETPRKEWKLLSSAELVRNMSGRVAPQKQDGLRGRSHRSHQTV